MGWLTDILREYPALSVAKERLALAEERFGNLEDENKKLKQRIEQLEKENRQLRAQLPAPSGKALEEIEVDILKLLSHAGEDGVEASVIGQRLGIHNAKAEYYLEKMAESDLLYQALFVGSPPLYSLGQKGREYLVKNGLV